MNQMISECIRTSKSVHSVRDEVFCVRDEVFRLPVPNQLPQALRLDLVAFRWREDIAVIAVVTWDNSKGREDEEGE